MKTGCRCEINDKASESSNNEEAAEISICEGYQSGGRRQPARRQRRLYHCLCLCGLRAYFVGRTGDRAGGAMAGVARAPL